jgi:HEAT repeat protein
MPALKKVLLGNGVTPEITAAARTALTTSPELETELMKVLASASSPSAKGLYEVLLASPQVTVRRNAAAELQEFSANHALWAHASDPDPLVRDAVADSLRTRGTVGAAIDAHALAALRTLLRDENADVRASATYSLIKIGRPLEAELYRALLDDPSPSVREHLAWLEHPDDDLVRDVLATLATDPASGVRTSVDDRLQGDAWTNAGVLLPAARLRLQEVDYDPHVRRKLIEHLRGFEEGLRVLIDGAVSSTEDAVLDQVFANQGYQNFSSSTGGSWVALMALDDDPMVALLERLSRSDRSAFTKLLQTTSAVTPPRWNVALRVAESDAVDPSQRLLALMHAAAGGGARVREVLVDVLGGDHLGVRELSAEEAQMLHRVMDAVPEAERNPLALAVLAAEGIRDPLRAVVAGSYEPRATGGREVTLRVLDRWLEGAAAAQAADPVATALLHLASLPDDLDPAMLERAVRHPLHAEGALRAIAILPDARYLPVVRAALNPTWARDRDDVQMEALAVLSASPAEEATQILLDAMVTAPEDYVRQQAAAALDVRRERLERLQAWERAAGARLDEVDAAARLIALLKDGDPAIRAEAARGLATLRAVQALPLLIEALRDEDAGVRAAVQEALDRLNAAEEPGRKE